MSQKKVWFITGCSTGFGRELASQLIEQQYPVVITARNPESLLELAQGREDQVLSLKLDVTNTQQIQEAVSAAQALIHIAELDTISLRLLLGKAAYQAATYKFTNLLSSIEDWKETTINADFPLQMNSSCSNSFGVTRSSYVEKTPS